MNSVQIIYFKEFPNIKIENQFKIFQVIFSAEFNLINYNGKLRRENEIIFDH